MIRSDRATITISSQSGRSQGYCGILCWQDIVLADIVLADIVLAVDRACLLG
jgi:hypothetical protein